MPTISTDRDSQSYTTLPDIFRTAEGINFNIGPQDRIRNADGKRGNVPWGRGRGREPELAPASYPRIVLRDALGYELDTFTTLQEAIYRAKWKVKQSGHAETPLEWRLPKAPPPARPDLTRSFPPLKHPPVETELDKLKKRLPYSNVLEFDVDDVGFVRESLQYLPYVPSLSFLRQEILSGPKMYFQIVGTMLLHERILSLTEKRNAVYNFPGFCSGCLRLGLCYGCDKSSIPHYHEDKPVKTGGGFTYFKKDRPENEIKSKNPVNWKIQNPDQALKKLMEEYGGIDLEGKVPEEIKKHLDAHGGHRERHLSHIPDFAAEMANQKKTPTAAGAGDAGHDRNFLPDVVASHDLDSDHDNKIHGDLSPGEKESRSHVKFKGQSKRQGDANLDLDDEMVERGQSEDEEDDDLYDQGHHGQHGYDKRSKDAKGRSRSEEIHKRRNIIDIDVGKRGSSYGRGERRYSKHSKSSKSSKMESDDDRLTEEGHDTDGGRESGRKSRSRKNLYKPPAPFKLKKSPSRRIEAKSPFSQDRKLDLPTGSAFQLKKSDKAPTKFKAFRNVDVTWKEPKKFELKENKPKPTKFWSAPRKKDDDGSKKKLRKVSPRGKGRSSPVARTISPDSGLDSELMTVVINKKSPTRNRRHPRKVTPVALSTAGEEESASPDPSAQTPLDNYSDTAAAYYKYMEDIGYRHPDNRYRPDESPHYRSAHRRSGLTPLTDYQEESDSDENWKQTAREVERLYMTQSGENRIYEERESDKEGIPDHPNRRRRPLPWIERHTHQRQPLLNMRSSKRSTKNGDERRHETLSPQDHSSRGRYRSGDRRTLPSRARHSNNTFYREGFTSKSPDRMRHEQRVHHHDDDRCLSRHVNVDNSTDDDDDSDVSYNEEDYHNYSRAKNVRKRQSREMSRSIHQPQVYDNYPDTIDETTGQQFRRHRSQRVNPTYTRPNMACSEGISTPYTRPNTACSQRIIQPYTRPNTACSQRIIQPYTRPNTACSDWSDQESPVRNYRHLGQHARNSPRDRGNTHITNVSVKIKTHDKNAQYQTPKKYNGSRPRLMKKSDTEALTDREEPLDDETIQDERSLVKSSSNRKKYNLRDITDEPQSPNEDVNELTWDSDGAWQEEYQQTYGHPGEWKDVDARNQTHNQTQVKHKSKGYRDKNEMDEKMVIYKHSLPVKGIDPNGDTVNDKFENLKKFMKVIRDNRLESNEDDNEWFDNSRDLQKEGYQQSYDESGMMSVKKGKEKRNRQRSGRVDQVYRDQLGIASDNLEQQLDERQLTEGQSDGKEVAVYEERRRRKQKRRQNTTQPHQKGSDHKKAHGENDMNNSVANVENEDEDTRDYYFDRNSQYYDDEFETEKYPEYMTYPHGKVRRHRRKQKAGYSNLNEGDISEHGHTDKERIELIDRHDQHDDEFETEKYPEYVTNPHYKVRRHRRKQKAGYSNLNEGDISEHGHTNKESIELIDRHDQRDNEFETEKYPEYVTNPHYKVRRHRRKQKAGYSNLNEGDISEHGHTNKESIELIDRHDQPDNEFETEKYPEYVTNHHDKVRSHRRKKKAGYSNLNEGDISEHGQTDKERIKLIDRHNQYDNEFETEKYPEYMTNLHDKVRSHRVKQKAGYSNLNEGDIFEHGHTDKERIELIDRHNQHEELRHHKHRKKSKQRRRRYEPDGIRQDVINQNMSQLSDSENYPELDDCNNVAVDLLKEPHNKQKERLYPVQSRGKKEMSMRGRETSEPELDVRYRNRAENKVGKEKVVDEDPVEFFKKESGDKQEMSNDTGRKYPRKLNRKMDQMCSKFEPESDDLQKDDNCTNELSKRSVRKRHRKEVEEVEMTLGKSHSLYQDTDDACSDSVTSDTDSIESNERSKTEGSIRIKLKHGQSLLRNTDEVGKAVRDEFSVSTCSDPAKQSCSPPAILGNIDFEKCSLTSHEPDLELVFDDVIDVENLEVVDDVEYDEEEKKRRRRQRHKRRKRREAGKARAVEGVQEQRNSENELKSSNEQKAGDETKNTSPVLRDSDGDIAGQAVEQVAKENTPLHYENTEGKDNSIKQLGEDSDESDSDRDLDQHRPGTQGRETRSTTRSRASRKKEAKERKSKSNLSNDRSKETKKPKQSKERHSTERKSQERLSKDRSSIDRKSKERKTRSLKTTKDREDTKGSKNSADLEKEKAVKKKKKTIVKEEDVEHEFYTLPSIQTQISKIMSGLNVKKDNQVKDIDKIPDHDSEKTSEEIKEYVKNMPSEKKWELVRPKSEEFGDIEGLDFGVSGSRLKMSRSKSMPSLTDTEDMLKQMGMESFDKMKQFFVVPVYLPSFRPQRPKKQFKPDPRRVKGRERSMSVSMVTGLLPFMEFEDSTVRSELETLKEEPLIIPTPSPEPIKEPEPPVMDEAPSPSPLSLQVPTPDKIQHEPPPPKRREIVKKEKKVRTPAPKPPTPVREPTPTPSPLPSEEEPAVTSRDISFVFERQPVVPELPPIEIPALPDIQENQPKQAQKVKKELKLIEVTPELPEAKKKLPPPPKLGPRLATPPSPTDRLNKLLRRPHGQLRRSKVAEAPVTTKELQQLSDPLDFLAKYCIINPERLPFYERVFNGAVTIQTPRYSRDEGPRPGAMVSLPPAILSEHELNMLRDLTVLSHAQTPRREGVSAPEQYLEKLNYTVEFIKGKVDTIQDHMQKLQGEKMHFMANLAKEMDRDIARLDYKVTGKKKKKEDTKKKKKKKVDVVDYDKVGAMSGNPKDFKPTKMSDITDEVIVSRMNDKMMKKVKKDPVVKTLMLEISRDIEKLKHFDQRMAQIEDEKDLVGLYCMDYYFSEQAASSRPHEFRRQQSRLYQKLHPDPDIEMNMEEVEIALQQINNKLLTEKEFQYIYFILDLPKREKISFRLFSIIAALSEKVTQMDPVIRKLINKHDYNALDVKMEKSKELFDLLQDADIMPMGNAPADNLAVELTAGGLTPEHTNYVLSKFDRDGRGCCDFLDFVTYVPLFIQIHKRIIDDPFNDSLDI